MKDSKDITRYVVIEKFAFLTRKWYNKYVNVRWTFSGRKMSEGFRQPMDSSSPQKEGANYGREGKQRRRLEGASDEREGSDCQPREILSPAEPRFQEGQHLCPKGYGL